MMSMPFFQSIIKDFSFFFVNLCDEKTSQTESSMFIMTLQGRK